MSRTYIIAEAGVNHNGSLDLARELIDVAAEAGADAVKFQTFRADSLVTPSAPKAAYQRATTDAQESQHAMLKALELNADDHQSLVEHCTARGVQFLSTPFDTESLRMLVERFKMPRIKIPSGEITNGPLLLAAARTGRPIILSTGMSTLGEVEEALGVLAFGYTEIESTPGLKVSGRRMPPTPGRMRCAIASRCFTAHPNIRPRRSTSTCALWIRFTRRSGCRLVIRTTRSGSPSRSLRRRGAL
jgi:hypothetical protein